MEQRRLQPMHRHGPAGRSPSSTEAAAAVPPPFSAAAARGLTARAMTDADLPFVEALYASTREEELAATGWPIEARRAFLAQQHDAQHRHYRAHYDGAEWLILEREGRPIGRLYLVEWSREFRIIDISFRPEARGSGLGGAVLTDVLEAAAAAGKGVSIHVEVNNPARRLYERMGFAVAEDKGIHLLMEWTPAQG